MASDIWCFTSRGPRLLGVLKWQSVLVLLVLATVLRAVSAHNQGPSSEFSNYKIVKPKIFHARSRRSLDSTRENDKKHVDLLTLSLELDGKERVFDLRLNRDLLPERFQRRYQHLGGVKEYNPGKVELCHYQGTIRGLPGSWVAVSTCRGLRGTIFDGKETHYVQPESNSLDSEHYIYRGSHLTTNKTCGYEGSPHHTINKLQLEKAFLRHKRSAEVIRGPYNANRKSRYVELVMVIDRSEYRAHEENLSVIYQHCKDLANVINALYMQLNIFVALVGVEVWKDRDESDISSKGDETLNSFLEYRKKKLIFTMPNDNAQLLTQNDIGKGVVGKALKGPICTEEYSGGVSRDHSKVLGLVAATIAHEMGHNFGMEHDTDDCECPDGSKCIMTPSSNDQFTPVHWSLCSLEYLALAFEHGMDYCLRNKPKRLFDGPICGNGFVESGEQCDCGLKENCTNPCCDATTCMLFANASCATGECCDLHTCKPKNAGSECRSAEHECDLPEYCTGQSEYCPNDVFKMDGETCASGKAYCFQGSCRTHDNQCSLLWGPTGRSADRKCYDNNSNGSRYGNCGYNKEDRFYYKCEVEDNLCGMLHCYHLNERLQFGMESAAIIGNSFGNSNGTIIPCRSVRVNLGLDHMDPGLVPNGAKCASGKMCVDQKCLSIADLQARIGTCPNGCNGNGVCNSLGHCHCNRGYRSPDCLEPGFGGSVDSGPAQDPNARNDFVTAMYIIFLGIIPMCALAVLGVWYVRNNAGHQWKKSTLSTLNRGGNVLSVKTVERSSPSPRNIETIDSRLSQDPACASLLPKSDPDERYNNHFFGQFKGFSITPMKAPPAAPTPPVAPSSIHTVPITTNLKLVQRNNTLRSALASNAPIVEPTAPALPPMNPGSTARPLISSPVLAATTCTSVDLDIPKVPTRKAPDIPSSAKEAPQVPAVMPAVSPAKPPRPTSSPLTNSVSPEPKRHPDVKTSTLTRIASILRPGPQIGWLVQQTPWSKDERANSMPKKTIKAMDKNVLRSLEISGPILQKEIEVPETAISVLPDEEKRNNVVMRAQSMRDPKITPRPNIQSFGSMRKPSPMKRPSSIPNSARPTSPPPGPPKPSENKVDRLNNSGSPSAYQIPSVKSNPVVSEDMYDDCCNLKKISEESPSSDNIYAVIEEAVQENKKSNPDSEYKTPKPVDSNMELLSEIVSEISNRNFDSIYSTTTLNKKKKQAEKTKMSEQDNCNNTYVNSSYYNSPARVYSNTKNSASPGCLNSSAINAPAKKTEEETAGGNKETITKVVAKKVEKVKPPLNRTKTPPTIARKTESRIESKKTSRQNSDASLKSSKSNNNLDPGLDKLKSVPLNPANDKLNSPDVVSSCSNQNATKSPDVLDGSKPRAKITSLPKTTPVASRVNSFSEKKKSPLGNKNFVKDVKADDKKAPRAKSNVASLQQKFEQKNAGGAGVVRRETTLKSAEKK